jgi:hypothetical protein
MMLTTHVPLSTSLEMTGAVTLFVHLSVWRGEGQIYLLFIQNKKITGINK